MACSDSPPCGRVRCVGQVHVSAQTRTGLGGPAATPAHSEEVPTADTPGSSRPWREEGSDSSRPPTSQKHCEPVKIRSLLSRTSQFLKSLRFNPHGRPQVAGQGWELTPTLGGGDRQGAESRSADHVRDTRGSSHRACAPAPASAQRCSISLQGPDCPAGCPNLGRGLRASASSSIKWGQELRPGGCVQGATMSSRPVAQCLADTRCSADSRLGCRLKRRRST